MIVLIKPGVSLRDPVTLTLTLSQRERRVRELEEHVKRLNTCLEQVVDEEVLKGEDFIQKLEEASSSEEALLEEARVLCTSKLRQVKAVHSRIASLENQLASNRDVRVSAQEEAREHVEAQQKLQVRLAELQLAAQQAALETRAIDKDARTREKALEDLTKAQEALKETLASTQASQKALEVTKAGKDAEIAAVVAVKDGLLEQLTAVKASVAQFSSQAQEQDTRLRVLEKEVVRLKSEIANEEERLGRLKSAEQEASLSQHHGTIVALKAELEAKQKQRCELTRRWRGTGDALSSLQEEREALIAKIGDVAYESDERICSATEALECAVRDLAREHREATLRAATG